MRLSLPVFLAFLTIGCDRGAEPVANQNAAATEQSTEGNSSGNLPVQEASENRTAEAGAAVPPEPPNNPALAALSPARRRDYDRGYRDCARGQYAFNADQQGEYYRIGCMTAENAKAGSTQ